MESGSESRKRGRSSKVSRERILEASLVEFAEHGYEGATTASVARRVGVTQPLIHYHFGSKEALWRAAVDLAFSRMQGVLQGVEDDVQRSSPQETIRMLARRFVFFTAKNPEIGRLMLNESGVPSARLDWMVERHLRPLFEQIEGLFQAGFDAGILKKLPVEHVMFAFLGAVPHFFDSAALVRLLYRIEPTDQHLIDRHADVVVEIFSRGLLVDPDSL